MAKVYVSSTFADLKRERQAVLDWLRAARHQVVDSYLLDSDTVRDSYLADVDSCDLYVLILGHRYGFRPSQDNPEGLSITHLEFRRAGQSGIPRIALLRTSVPDVSLSDLADPQRLALVFAFRQEVAREVRPAEFSNMQGLIQGLSTGINNELERRYKRPVDSSPGIFLSYRREDAAPYARLLQYEMTKSIPGVRIFMDLESIEPGLDVAQVITEAVDSCAVLVALIGRQWVTLADEKGRRRIDDPNDFVRFEIRTALERGVRVLPVLVDGAEPLRRQLLPAELRELARLNALELSAGRYDVDPVLDFIQRALYAPPSTYADHLTDVQVEATIPRPDRGQLKLISDALVANYDHQVLEQELFFELNKRLDEISAPDSLPNVVFRLLTAAEREGWLLELLRMFQNSSYPEVREAAARILSELRRPKRRGVRAESPVRSRQVKVFLCHSSSDKSSVRALRRRLLDDGIQPWFDEEDILPGQDWDSAIHKAIRASDMVIVCLSMASVTKVGYLQKEIRSVLDVADEQPEGTIFLIPVRLEPCDVPERLRRWQWVDLFDDRGYLRLVKSLRSRDHD